MYWNTIFYNLGGTDLFWAFCIFPSLCCLTCSSFCLSSSKRAYCDFSAIWLAESMRTGTKARETSEKNELFNSQLNFAWGLRSGPSISLKFDWLRPVLLHFNLTPNTWLLTFNGKRPHRKLHFNRRMVIFITWEDGDSKWPTIMSFTSQWGYRIWKWNSTALQTILSSCQTWQRAGPCSWRTKNYFKMLLAPALSYIRWFAVNMVYELQHYWMLQGLVGVVGCAKDWSHTSCIVKLWFESR